MGDNRSGCTIIAPANALSTARRLMGYCGKSEIPSYWNEMSVVVIPVLFGVGSPKVTSQIGTVPRKANRSSSPPLGRFRLDSRVKLTWDCSAAVSCFRSDFSTLSTLVPWEYPKM